MIYNIYSVRDRLTGYTGLVLDQTDETASRSFGNSFAAGSIQQYKPTDFDLYCLGQFDTIKGVITPIDPRLVLTGYAIDFANKHKNGGADQ